MRSIKIILLATVCISSCFAEDRPDPRSLFKNLDKLDQKYKQKAEEERRNFDQEAHDEKMWLHTSAKKWEKQDSLKPEEIERLWVNFEKGADQRKYLAFSWISYFEPLEEWLPNLKELISSEIGDDQLAAFSVIDAYSRNDYGRYRNKEIFRDPEILQTVTNYTEEFKNKDKHFKRRVQKMQESVEEIRANLGSAQAPINRPEKPILDAKEPERLKAQGEQISERKSSEADKPSSFPWWLLGIVGLIVVLGFLLLKDKSK